MRRKLTRDTSFGSDDMSAMVIRQLSRAEVALCMLCELAHHHDDVFRGHLPVLLLICVIKIDCTDELVHRHAHQVLDPTPPIVHDMYTDEVEVQGQVQQGTEYPSREDCTNSHLPPLANVRKSEDTYQQ